MSESAIPGPTAMVAVMTTVNPEWLTSTVMGLMRHIASTYEWSQFPILADALQDAGCDNDELLNLLRHRVHDPESLKVLSTVWHEFNPVQTMGR